MANRSKLFLVAVAMVFMAVPEPLSAQECGDDCRGILEAAIEALAERYGERLGLRPAMMVVDTTDPGRVAMATRPESGRALPMTAADVEAVSERLGFRTISNEEYHLCFSLPEPLVRPSFCDPATLSVGVVPSAPRVEGDAGSIHLNYTVDDPTNLRRVNAYGIAFTLEREGSEWRVTDAQLTAQGGRYRAAFTELLKRPEPVPDDECGEDCRGILEAAIETLAERYEEGLDLRPAVLVVDASDPGRVATATGPQSWRALPMTAADVEAVSGRLGLRTISRAEYLGCFFPPSSTARPTFCDSATLVAGVVPYAPRVEGDAGSIVLAHDVRDPASPGRVNSHGILFTLRRSGSAWHVTDAAPVARGEPYPPSR